MAVLRCSDLDAHEEEGVRQVLLAERAMTPQPDSLYTTCYMLCCQHWFFFFSLCSKGKLIAKRGENLFSYCLGLRRVPGWRRTAVGEGWPTRCLLRLPCLAAQSLWQNKPAGILGKHWEPLTGTLKAPQPKKYWGEKKSFTLPNTWLFFFFLNWIVSPVIKDEPQSRSRTLVRPVCKGGWLALQTNTLF